MDETRFALIRHAESAWNASGRWQGHGDPPLSPNGRRQAETLAAQLAGEPFDVLICSDLLRAIETAEAIGAACGLTARPDPTFRELDVHRWTGLREEEIAAREPDTLRRFQEGADPDVRAGGGESRRDIRERVRAGVEALAAEHTGRYIALVCHLGVIRALLPGSEPGNASWTKTTLEEMQARIRGVGS